MCRAIVHDPEDATGVVIRRPCHHLLDESVKGCDTILRFAAPKDSGPVDVQCRDVGPGATTEVFMLDMHGSARTATLRGVFAAARLNAGLFIGGDNEFVILQRSALPLSGVEIQYAAALGGEVRVAREYPTAVVPGPNGVLMQPAPQRAAADRGNQTALLDLLNQLTGAPAGQRHTVLGRQFTRQSLNLNDEIWGEKSGGDPDERALPALEGGQRKSASAKERPLHGGCPDTRRSRRWACLRLRRESSWPAGPENTATYIFPRADAIRLPRQMRE